MLNILHEICDFVSCNLSDFNKIRIDILRKSQSILLNYNSIIILFLLYSFCQTYTRLIKMFGISETRKYFLAKFVLFIQHIICTFVLSRYSESDFLTLLSCSKSSYSEAYLPGLSFISSSFE